ncbi:MAG: urease accessory UreF family protein [Micropruina sp.]|uniref:urease accessory protein UreF n=1 Tax=Micropruina sp. TaxID=2737536 RepID=UPI0039E2DC51
MPSTPTEPGGPGGWGSLPGWQLPLAQLCDSAAPTGAFSHSLGLETYVVEGRVDDEHSFGDWLAAMLTGPLATGDALAVRLVAEAVRDRLPERAWWVDRHLHAQTLPRQTRDAVVAMGARMLAIASIACPSAWLDAYAAAVASGRCHGHPAVAVGVAGAGLRAPSAALVAAHLQGVATTLTQNAVRLIPLGQNAGQRALAAARPHIEAVVERVPNLSLDDFGATLPGLEIAQMRHERLRARMYQS